MQLVFIYGAMAILKREQNSPYALSDRYPSFDPGFSFTPSTLTELAGKIPVSFKAGPYVPSTLMETAGKMLINSTSPRLTIWRTFKINPRNSNLKG